MKALLRLGTSHEAGIATMLVLLTVLFGSIEPRFLTAQSLNIVLLATPLILIASMGQMLVILSRQIDLSIGSILGFSAIAAGLVFRDYPHWPLAVGFAVALGSGAALGCVNGLLVTVFKLPSIIVTLGTLSLYRGLVFIVSGGRQIDPNHIPESLIAMSQTSRFGVPWIVIIALGVAIAIWLLLAHSHVGRQIYAIGSNPQAARLRGIRVEALTVLVFTICGLLAGLAGIVYAARFGYVNPGITGVGFEFTVIAAVVIGGVSIGGGSGSVWGALLGVLLLGAISVALPLLGVSAFWQSATQGAIILIALLVDRWMRQSGQRAAAVRAVR